MWFLCDLITSLGLNQENLFLQPGLRSEIGQLREWLDTGLPVTHPNVSIHSAAETLLLFTGKRVSEFMRHAQGSDGRMIP